MFIFRWISNTLAIIGLILTTLLVYFSFYPLQTILNTKLTLKEIAGCDATKFIVGSKIDSTQINQIKNNFSVTGDNSLEVVKQFQDGLNSFASQYDIEGNLSVSYCKLKTNPADTLANVRSYLGQRKNYTYGTIDDFIKAINSIPFLQLSLNFNTQSQNIVARSSYCTTPINKSDFYLFSVIKVNEETYLSMYELNVSENNPSFRNERIINLLTTGQFIKSKLYCNG